jgi:hypothetical protein
VWWGKKEKGAKKWLKAKQGKGYSLLKAIVNNFFLKMKLGEAMPTNI